MELRSRIKEYFSLSAKEIEAIVVSTLIIAFIVSFKEWGIDKFDLVYGIRNLLDSVIIVALALLVRISVEKIEALRRGYRVEFRVGLYGLLAGLILVFVSNGLLFLLIPGGIAIYMIKGLRLGRFRYGINRFEVAMIALLGVMANIFLAIFLKALMLVSESALLNKAVFINVWLAIFAMLPIPPLEGSRIFFASRLTYFFTLGCVLGAGILLYLTNILTAVIGSLVVGVVIWLSYLIFFEK